MKALDTLAEKRALLIAPRFFGYEDDIKRELERRGAQVDFLPDRPFSSSLLKAIARLYRPAVSLYSERVMDQHIRKISQQPYDLVFVIVGEALTASNVKTLRQLNPEARFILYMWDSFGNKKYIKDNLPFFDITSTFDRVDAAAYGMRFRPLFFVPGFAENNVSQIDYDVSFIGTAHSDRYLIVRNLQQALPSRLRTFFYLYLQAPWVYTVRRIFDRHLAGARREAFHFEPIAKNEVQKVFERSFAILDIEHPKQQGLTMRTFEALGARKKLITTNQDVRHYDFYDPRNILVYDRAADPVIPAGFFENPYIDPDECTFLKYSLEGWLDEILNFAIGDQKK